MKESQERQKHLYNRKVRGAVLNKGDIPLVKIVAYDGTHKIADKWESFPYIVLSQPNLDVTVYGVQREDGIGKVRTLHNNSLLPINFIPEERVQIVSKPVPRHRKKKTVQQDPTPTRNVDSDSDSDYGYSGVPRNVTQNAPSVVTEDKQGQRVPRVVMLVTTMCLPRSHVIQEAMRTLIRLLRMQMMLLLIQIAKTACWSGWYPRIGYRGSSGDEEDNKDTAPQTEAATPVPETRSSSRARKPPDWMISGEFFVHQHTAEPDWKVRAEFLCKLSKISLDNRTRF